MDGFTRLATGGCPPIADLMLALAAEFHDVDTDAADQRLDELALPSSASPAAICASPPPGLANILDTDPGFDADRSSVAGLWFDAALEARAGHPLVLAALDGRGRPPRRPGGARPLRSRRAGTRASPTASACGSSTRRWTAASADPWSLRRHCTHELAFAALLGLSERFNRAGDRRGSAKAALLRARLPLKTT